MPRMLGLWRKSGVFMSKEYNAYIDQEECIQCNLCEETFPEKFITDLRGEVCVIENIERDDADLCPTTAIIMREDKG